MATGVSSELVRAASKPRPAGRRVLLALLAFMSAVGAAAPGAPVSADSGAGACREVTIRAALSPDIPTPTYPIYGLLCETADRLPGTIQLFVSGATEGGPAYWDFPTLAYYGEDPREYLPLRNRYSYVHQLNELGYVSLTIDRIGTGKSGHPPAELVTLPANAYVVHQVIAALRKAPGEAGKLGTVKYARVIGGGRSLGAAVLYETSVDYGGLDGLIIQSFRQHRQPPFATFPSTFVPAQSDPRFANLPPNYYTTRPGTRGGFFFHRPTADQGVIDHEERTKETVTSGEVATLAPSFEYTKKVSVPVLSLVGEYDTFFCSGAGCPAASEEAGFFPLLSGACFESHVIPDAGHDMNLQANNKKETFPLMIDWIRRNFRHGSALTCR